MPHAVPHPWPLLLPPLGSQTTRTPRPTPHTQPSRRLQGATAPVTKGKHGGLRPGAGAPKGNLNRLRHGRHATNPTLARLIQTLNPEQRAIVLPILRLASDTINRRMAWVDKAHRRPANVVAFPSATTTQPTVQSSERLTALTYRLAVVGVFGSAIFVHKHAAGADVIEQALDHFEQLGWEGVHNPAALIVHSIHQELAEPDGSDWRCPYCRWTDAHRRGKERAQ